ncbi:PAQR family membrane homeostasis protein TrhA [Brumimicrobium mesophilum]|uniref:PAQR family membrane homeostasis protein TrhA n=1 Tax=Brumimicrobium mesophilum TaxID=392717 RepID=UPI000D141F16|nr:hemolysin III family protein [Brumimicrobium mesophilum]
MNSYSPKEEKLNVITHAFGFILSFVAVILLILKASFYGGILATVSVSIFGASLIVLYAASTMYHNAKTIELRIKLKIFDHAAIFVLIAGTYTPFTLITLEGSVGWLVFSVIWGMALIGITLKLFFTGRYKILSTIMYILMGWVIIFAVKPLVESLSSEGLFWLFAGGFFYTIGAIIYSIKKIKFNHAIFHLFVLGGSFCHFYSVYNYVLPGE